MSQSCQIGTLSNKGESVFMKRIMLLFGIVFSMLGVYADENVLQTIEIEPVKDTYNIVLVSDKAVDVKKTVQASNKINLVLKDIRVSKTINTIYNNVSNVDTVMVEQQGSGINIFFQAENAEAATVTFDALIPAPTKSVKSDSTQVKLNNPIESYAPIYKEEYQQNAKTSKLYNKLKESTAISDIKDGLDEATNGDTANKFISYGLITLLVVAVSRLFKRKEPEMKIGLAQQFTGVNPENYGGTGAGYQPTFNSPMGAKPFTNVSYGINAYKNGERNPYETAPMQFHNPRLNNYVRQAQEPSAQPVMTKTAVKPATATQTVSKGMTTPVNTAPVNQSNPNVDNLKFLESMTAIYEKSGRHDLARGLKASLSKNNLK